MRYYADPRRLVGGFDVDVNATRFSNYFHVERDLVHVLGGWIARAPETEVKIGLGTHVWEDAEHGGQIRQRIKELRYPSEYPMAPDERLITLAERVNAAEDTLLLLVGVYEVIKPHLITSYRLHQALTDPIMDEPSIRLLRRMEEEEDQQVRWGRALIEELKRTPADRDRALAWRRQLEGLVAEIGEIGALPLAKGRRQTWLREERLLRPAKEPFVQIQPGGDPLVRPEYSDHTKPVSTDPEDLKHFLHWLVQAEMQAAEVVGRNIADYPEMPWEFHHAMARQAWDEVRHALIHLKQLEEWGVAWGDYPIAQGTDRFLALDLFGRLVKFNLESEGGAPPRHRRRRSTLRAAGLDKTGRIFDYLLADEGLHIQNGSQWSKWLCDFDEPRYQARIAELNAAFNASGPRTTAATQATPSRDRPDQREGR
jgi:uncharacterized ferritin-like protein (DUF455 family)